MATPTDNAIQIVAYRDVHATAFATLNREWLDAAGIYEEADGKHLYAPRANILAKGGEIYIAERGDEVVGTAALVPGRVDGDMELAKLVVADSARGCGLGRRLTQQVIDRARARGARRLFLQSNSQLVAAVRLYEAMGFEHREPLAAPDYETADVYMVLELA